MEKLICQKILNRTPEDGMAKSYNIGCEWNHQNPPVRYLNFCKKMILDKVETQKCFWHKN
jgi:hypothetical protein